MSGSIIIAGRGPSAFMYDWPDDGINIMAVSGGINAVPECRHFVTMDAPMHYKPWVSKSERFDKHIMAEMYEHQWNRHPRVIWWDYDRNNPTPHFQEGPISGGPLSHNYSLFAAVQVAPRLGYDRLIFVGVDLTDLPDNAGGPGGPQLCPVIDTMEHWHGLAVAEGLRWENASPLSHLCAFVPDATDQKVEVH